jgi:hypothetical protein
MSDQDRPESAIRMRRNTHTGRYSVVQPHQAGMCSVRPGSHPCGRRCSARMRMTATSRPQVQQALVGRGRPAASSQIGGVMRVFGSARLFSFGPPLLCEQDKVQFLVLAAQPTDEEPQEVCIHGLADPVVLLRNSPKVCPRKQAQS